MPRDKGCHVEPASHGTDRVLCRTGRYPDHDVGVEDEGGKEDPEDIVDQETQQQEGRHLQAGQADEGDECDTQPHPHGIHQQPVTGQDPDADDGDGEGEGDDFRHREPATESE